MLAGIRRLEPRCEVDRMMDRSCEVLFLGLCMVKGMVKREHVLQGRGGWTKDGMVYKQVSIVKYSTFSSFTLTRILSTLSQQREQTSAHR
jgi:hypothetical protein